MIPPLATNQSQVPGFTNSSSSYYSNRSLPSTVAPKNLIAPFWDDLHFRGVQRASYVRDEHNFTVQYTDVSRFSGSGAYTFQVTLRETGQILFHYLAMVARRRVAEC